MLIEVSGTDTHQSLKHNFRSFCHKLRQFHSVTLHFWCCYSQNLIWIKNQEWSLKGFVRSEKLTFSQLLKKWPKMTEKVCRLEKDILYTTRWRQPALHLVSQCLKTWWWNQFDDISTGSHNISYRYHTWWRLIGSPLWGTPHSNKLLFQFTTNL